MSKFINVTATASDMFAPDTMVINCNLTLKGESYEGLTNEYANEHKLFVSELKNLTKRTLKQRNYSVSVNKEYENNHYVDKGLVLRSDLEIILPINYNLLNDIIRLIGKHNAISVSVSYQLAKSEQFSKQLIAKAIKTARQKADIIAEASGLVISDIANITYQQGERAMAYAMRAVSNDVDFSAKEIRLSESVVVEYEVI
ncbi:MAG: SIMPL domain-containing protein [Clostridia bacterium]